MLSAIGLVAGRVGSAALTWLSQRSFWQLVCIGLAILLVITHFQMLDARSDAARWQKQYTQIHTQLEAISTKRDEQKATTRENVRVVTRTIKEADERAKVIEEAPLPGGCKTPAQVMGADL